MTPLLEVRDASKVFTTGGFVRKKRHVAVEHVSLSISADRPSITAIAGESGSGKTTLARLILGIIRPSAGQILYKGKPVTGARVRLYRRESQAPCRACATRRLRRPDGVLHTPYLCDHPIATTNSGP